MTILDEFRRRIQKEDEEFAAQTKRQRSAFEGDMQQEEDLHERAGEGRQGDFLGAAEEREREFGRQQEGHQEQRRGLTTGRAALKEGSGDELAGFAERRQRIKDRSE